MKFEITNQKLFLCGVGILATGITLGDYTRIQLSDWFHLNPLNMIGTVMFVWSIRRVKK